MDWGFSQVNLHSTGISSVINVFNATWQVIDEFDQNVHFVEIDIEEDPEIAEAAGIMGTPCMQFFKNKEMLRFVIFYLSSSYFSIYNLC